MSQSTIANFLVAEIYNRSARMRVILHPNKSKFSDVKKNSANSPEILKKTKQHRALKIETDVVSFSRVAILMCVGEDARSLFSIRLTDIMLTQASRRFKIKNQRPNFGKVMRHDIKTTVRRALIRKLSLNKCVGERDRESVSIVDVMSDGL